LSKRDVGLQGEHYSFGETKMSALNHAAIAPARASKIQVDVKEIAQKPVRKSLIQLNVDADGSDASNEPR
jgi:hypothetical protein